MKDDVTPMTDAARSAFEEEFITNHIAQHGKGLDLKETYRRAVRALLQSGHQPSRLLQLELWGELESHWWPKPNRKAVRRLRNRRRAFDIDAELAVLAEQMRQQGVHDPIAQAKSKLAAKHGHHSSDALDRWLRRNR
jgi:hypothetical protein